jgi:hypothetical protein
LSHAVTVDRNEVAERVGKGFELPKLSIAPGLSEGVEFVTA